MTIPRRGLLAGANLLCVVAAENSSSDVPSSTDLLPLMAKLPSCVTTCSLNELVAANCSVVDIRNCLCTSDTMQAHLAICVLESCNTTEQTIATTFAQQDICKGIPQPSRSWEIIQCAVAISIITFLIIALHLLSRYLIAQGLFWDDWLLLLCALLLIPMAVIPVLNATKGFGQHFYTIPPESIPILRELYYVSQIFYAVVHPVAKLSMLLLYLRIFPDMKFRRVTQASIAFMSVHLVVFFFAVTFQCLPVSSIWDTSVPGKCASLVAIIYSGAILSIIEDIVIILLPIWQLKRLHMSVRKRLALVFMFSVGSFACFASMIRLKFIVEYNSSIDLTWDDVDLTIWSIIEVYSAVICVCLISIRPLVVKYCPKLFSGSQPTGDSRKPSWIRTPRLNSKLIGKYQMNGGGTTLITGDQTMWDTKIDPTKSATANAAFDFEFSPRSPLSPAKQPLSPL